MPRRAPETELQGYTARDLVLDAVTGWCAVLDSGDTEAIREGFEAFAHDCIEGTLEGARDDELVSDTDADALWSRALAIITTLVQGAA